MISAEGPRGMFELQLGHLCNDRCVFCVSGLLTSRGKAPLLRVEELHRALEDAAASGYRRVTLLGGEPTIQPHFLSVVRRAVALGMEVVVFSNGSKAGRSDLVDQVAATGGRFEWRFSFQGATREAHERVTRRRGSFDQLVAGVERARAHGHRVTVNTCVVRQNGASLDHFPALLVPLGVSQLHVDMVNPYDTGLLSHEDGGVAVGPVGGPLAPGEHPALRAEDAGEAGRRGRDPGSRLWGHDLLAIMPRYTELVGPLERMIAGFPEGFDVNIGNLPYCVAPHLAPFIHHGGPPTWTVTAGDRGEGALAGGRRKYLVKQSQKTKPDRCRDCVFDDRCTGVFGAYAQHFGTDELQPVSAARLAELDAGGRLFSLRAAAMLRGALAAAALPAPFDRVTVSEPGPREVRLVVEATGAEGARAVLSLRPPPGRGDPVGAAATEAFSMHAVEAPSGDAATRAALSWLWDAVLAAGARPVHPPGPDAVGVVAALLSRLRRGAPFGALAWTRVDAIEGGVELTLVSPGGERVVAWVTEAGGRARGGYRVEGASGAPPEALVDGVRRLLVALGRLPAAAGGE
jgi:Radical SAM superfamily